MKQMNQESIKIVSVSPENITDTALPNEHFLVFGKLIPYFLNGKWSWTEERLEVPYEKKYDDKNESDYLDFIGNQDKMIYLAYVENQCAGRIVMWRNWNQYFYIDDIAVRSQFRRNGIGRKLIQAAI